MSQSVEHDPVQQAVDEVRKRGDLLDADINLRDPAFRLSTFITAAAVAVPAGLLNEAGPLSYAETALPFALYVPAAFGAKAVVNRYRNARRVRQSEEARQSIIDAIDEPIDLVRFGKGRGRGLMLRWYGNDKAAEDATDGDFVARARNVVAFARKYDIDCIAARLPSELVSPTAMRQGPSLLSDTKHLKNSLIWDHDAAEDVVIEVVDDFDELIDIYEVEGERSLVAELVQAIGDINLAEKYAEFTLNEQHPVARQRLQSAVKRAIELNVEDVRTSAEKQADGSMLRRKVHSSIAVMRGGRVLHFDASANPVTGDSELAVAGIGPLAGSLGIGSNDELLRRIKTSNVAGLPKPQLLAGLHLLLERQDDVLQTVRTAPEEARDTAVEPMFDRIFEDDHSVTLSSMRVLRTHAVRIASFALALGLGYQAGVTMGHVADRAYSVDDAQYKSFAKKHMPNDQFVYAGDSGYKVYERTPGSGFSELRKLAWDPLFHLEDKHYALSNDIAMFMINDLHMNGMTAFVPDYGQQLFKQWQDGVRVADAPQNMYGPEANDQIGDVSSTSNRAIYTVTPLSGESTQGYWQDRFDNQINVTDNSPPFYGAGIDLSTWTAQDAPVQLPNAGEAIAQLRPDFLVQTPYINAGKTDSAGISVGDALRVDMPIKQGTKLVAARVIDTANPKLFVRADIYRDEDGMYFYDAANMDQRLAQAGIRQPELQYWLKDVKHDEMSTRAKQLIATGPLINSERSGHLTDRIEYDDIARQVRVALGLPADAKASQVLDAIKYGKKYSYTPLERAGVTHITLSDMDNTDAVEQIGGVLAQLDTANCNVASLTMLLATIDKPKFDEVTGFHNINGDNTLSEQEAHAWLIDRQTGKYVDPTPVVMAPGETNRDGKADKATPQRGGSHNLPLDPEKGAAVLLAAACMIVAYRRRKAIAKKLDAARTAASLIPDVMFSSVLAAEHGIYGRPGSANRSKPAGQTLAERAERYARNIPSAKVLGGVRGRFVALNDAAIRRFVAMQHDD